MKSTWYKPLFLGLVLVVAFSNAQNHGKLEQQLSMLTRTLEDVGRARTQSGPQTAVAPIHQEEARASEAEPKETRTEGLGLISRMKQGNARYMASKLSEKAFVTERAALVKGQKPFVIVVTCSDSRVVPEYVFDESLGQVFVIRVAGNVLDSVGLGSVEYAAEHLHAKMVLVLGHTECGAVKATVSGGEVPPNIGSIVKRIKPAVAAAKARRLDSAALLEASIYQNVVNQMQGLIQQSHVLSELQDHGELTIAGGVYHLDSGSVEFMFQSSSHSKSGH